MSIFYADDHLTCACGCGETPSPGRRFVMRHNLRAQEPKSEAHRAALSEAARRVWATKRERMPLGSRRMDVYGYWLININGVKTDNRIENLHVCSRTEHALAHGSFGALLPQLFDLGVVTFDRATGRYSLA